MEPQFTWMPDNASDQCLVCDKQFGYLSTWKHHCRLCGSLVCADCLGLEEEAHMYNLGPSQYERAYVPPLSGFTILDHPNASSTRVQLSQWLPKRVLSRTHLNPSAPKVCEPCGVRLAKERNAYHGARALCAALELLDATSQQQVLGWALVKRTLSEPDAFAVLGRWVHKLTTFQFYYTDIRSIFKFKFMCRLMNVLFNHWYAYIAEKKGMPSNTQTHTILTLLLNLSNDVAVPTMNLASVRLLLQDTMVAIHMLIGHQTLHYGSRLNTAIIVECWKRLFQETNSLALFVHNRLCCEAMCIIKQTNELSEKPRNGMFRPFFQFLKQALADKQNSTRTATYVQVVCALLHHTVFCQPRLAQGCAHVLHVDIETVQQFYAQCFAQMWNATHANANAFEPVDRRLDPLAEYRHKISILRAVMTPLRNDTPETDPIVQVGDARVVRLGSLILVPLVQYRYAYAIQHLVRLFFRAQPVGVLGGLKHQIQGICSRMHLFFGGDLSVGPSAGPSVVGYINSNILSLGTIQALDPSQPPSEWTVSILSYVILYFVLLLDPFLAQPAIVEPTSKDRSDMPIVATIDHNESQLVVMPYTLAACRALQTIMCTSPLPDAVLDEVQRVCDVFVRDYMPELWLAFIPLAHRDELDGERKLRAYFNKISNISTQDIFRSSFLHLLF